MCIACVADVEARPAAVAGRRFTIPGPDAPEAEVRAFVDAHVEDELAAGLRTGRYRTCARCGRPYGAEVDAGDLRRSECLSCETRWISERVVMPLIERLGRRGARKALRRLAQKAK